MRNLIFVFLLLLAIGCTSNFAPDERTKLDNKGNDPPKEFVECNLPVFLGMRFVNSGKLMLEEKWVGEDYGPRKKYEAGNYWDFVPANNYSQRNILEFYLETLSFEKYPKRIVIDIDGEVVQESSGDKISSNEISVRVSHDGEHISVEMLMDNKTVRITKLYHQKTDTPSDWKQWDLEWRR